MAERKLAQPVAVAVLPSASFFERLDDARQDWMKRAKRRGELGATELLGLLQHAFPNDAPKYPSVVTHWLKDEPSMPSIDNAYMLAVALGVNPTWLLLNTGPMRTEESVPAGSSHRRIDPKQRRRGVG